MPQGEADIVPTVEEAAASEGIDLEAVAHPAFSLNLLLLQVNRHPKASRFSNALKNGFHLLLGKPHREQAVLEAVVEEDVRKRGSDDATEAVVQKGPRGVFPRGAAPEVGSGDQDARPR